MLKCPDGHDNPDSTRFCGTCGKQIVATEAPGPDAGALGAAERDASASPASETNEVVAPGDGSTAPPGSPPGDNEDQDAPDGRRRKPLIVGLVALLVVGLAIGGAFVLLGGNSSATTVRTEPISTATADPFAPKPVGIDQAIPPVATPGTITVTGDHVGLYGGTLNQQVCDKNQLVSFLQANPAKAAAWAGVEGISPSQIPSYIATLTPAILRSDTAVTNHGYVNGHSDSIPAVLQAGTAVLVNNMGLPVTKCYCGNPLTRATAYTSPSYTGTRWQGFSTTNVTIITASTTIITNFTLVNPTTQQGFNRPAGSDGTDDGPYTGTPVASSPTTTPSSGTPATPSTGAPGPLDGTYALSSTPDAAGQCDSGSTANMQGNTLVISGSTSTIKTSFGTFPGTIAPQGGSGLTATFNNYLNPADTISVSGVLVLTLSGGSGSVTGTANASGGNAGGTGYGLLCNYPFTGALTTTPSTSSPSRTSGVPPCTKDAINTALMNAHEPDVEVTGNPTCVDGWATAPGGNQGTALKIVARAQGSTWTIVNLSELKTDCAKGAVPASLHACPSGSGRSISTTTTTKPKKRSPAVTSFDGTYSLIGTIPGAPSACNQADLNGSTLTLRGTSATIEEQQKRYPGTFTVKGQSKNQTFTITIKNYANPNETLTIRGAGGGSALNPILNTGDIAGTSNVHGAPNEATGTCSNEFTGTPLATSSPTTPSSSTADCTQAATQAAIQSFDPNLGGVQDPPLCENGYALQGGYDTNNNSMDFILKDVNGDWVVQGSSATVGNGGPLDTECAQMLLPTDMSQVCSNTGTGGGNYPGEIGPPLNT